VLEALGAVIPELWGGSADLAESNNTTIDESSSFLPEGNPLPGADPYGRTLHFGIREHADGRRDERHHPARRHPRLRRNLPGLQRLHARRRSGWRP
jgi:hypothetical protein